MHIDELGLSVRTSSLLQRRGVETVEQLLQLNLFGLIVAGAGHLAMREAREAQLAAGKRNEPVLVSETEVERSASGVVLDAAMLARLGGVLEQGGWTSEGPGAWRLWIKPTKAINRLQLAEGAKVAKFKLSQFDEDHDMDRACELVLVPKDWSALGQALAAVGDNLQLVLKGQAVVDTLRPHAQRAYVVGRTKEGEQVAGRPLLALEPPGSA